ncbi:neutral amino acid transporter [Ilyonectria robusta]
MMAVCALHCFTIVLGLFVTIAGTYTTIQSTWSKYTLSIKGSAFAISIGVTHHVDKSPRWI